MLAVAVSACCGCSARSPGGRTTACTALQPLPPNRPVPHGDWLRGPASGVERRGIEKGRERETDRQKERGREKKGERGERV